MQRNILTLALGASMIGAAALAACSGGGGGSSPTSVLSVPASAPGSSGTVGTLGSAQLTLTINRTPHVKRVQSTRRGAKGTRKPAYVSEGAQGLQVSVSATGVQTHTIYADLSATSPLCTPTPSTSTWTCTVTIPTVAANEQITATEVDASPAAPVVNGYGAVFPTGTNILAANTLSTTITLGTKTSLTLGLGPVAGGDQFYDCTGTFQPGGGPQLTTANFGFDGGGSSTAGRIVVTAGVASSGVIEPEYGDPSGNYPNFDTTPVPFVDVNGSHTPLTITSSSSAVTFAAMVNNGTPPPSGAFATTASIPDDGFQWQQCFFVVPVHVAATFTGTSATVTLNNNLTAFNPFLSPPATYAGTYIYNLAALTASAVSGSPAVTGTVTATVTGTDFMGTNGMMAESAVTMGDGACNSSGGATLATVAAAGVISTSTWQQGFTITPVAPGSCTFVLSDSDTDIPTLAIHVTVGP